MQKNIVIILLFILSTALPLRLTAQSDSAQVSVRSRAVGDTVYLRWAANSAATWRQTNRNGFTIMRYTVMRKGELLPQAEAKQLTEQPIKPRPLDEWEPLAVKNNFAAIIAQALYGEGFEVGEGEKGSIARIIALSQEQEQRYMLAMYAADLCFEAALMAGWAYIDTTAKADEHYLYRVIPVTAPNSTPVQFGFAYVALDEAETLPIPQELTAVFGDKSVLLTWNYEVLRQEYNTYFIERSTDNRDFKSISDLPVMNMQGTERIYYTDTLASNDATYYYRVKGLTIFGELGPPSDTVSGRGRTVLPYTPHITRSLVNNMGMVEIEWEFEEEGNRLIRSFELQRADNVRGPFQTVVPAISAAQRFVLYDKPAATNYFVIAAFPHEGEPRVSAPVLLQPVDTVPPAVPVGLQGVVDSSGVAHLSWTANTESDILGYRIYRAQDAGEELMPLNDTAWPHTYYTDTLSLRSLNNSVYYVITALDRRYNQSPPTALLPLKKPDIIPPSAPLIDHYEIKEQNISLSWTPSSSRDVAAYHIYRQTPALVKPLLIDSTAAAVHNYIDTSFIPGISLSYYIIAVDEAGLQSKPSPSVSLKAPGKANLSEGVQTFRGRPDRKNNTLRLQWTHQLQNVGEFHLYKKDAGEEKATFSLWKPLPANATTVDDANVVEGHTYHYMIRALYTNGKNTPVKTLSINY